MGTTRRGTRKNRDKQSRRKAERESNKAKWDALKKSGDNGKTGVRAKRVKKKTINTISHPNGPCDNIGCKKCNAEFYEKIKPSK